MSSYSKLLFTFGRKIGIVLMTYTIELILLTNIGGLYGYLQWNAPPY